MRRGLIDVTQLINLLCWLPGHSGFGSYVQRVVPDLLGLRLQLDRHGDGCLMPPQAWTAQPPPPAPGRVMRLLQRYSMTQHGLRLNALLAQEGLRPTDLELIYSPLFDALICWPQVPQLITCHDLTPLVFPNSRKAWLKYRFWQPRHLACARQVIAISRHVADQLVAFGHPADRIAVVPNGVRIERQLIPSAQTPNLLVLARHDANKNLPALVRALAGAQRRLPRWRGCMRIVGRHGADTPRLLRLQRDLPRPDGLELIAALPPEQLICELRSSLALVSASIEEGFDYPVLEAKAEGLPTLISDIPVHREFHQGSSLFFPSGDDGTVLADHLRSLLGDPASWQQLSRAGRSVARHYSLERQLKQIQALAAQLSR